MNDAERIQQIRLEQYNQATQPSIPMYSQDDLEAVQSVERNYPDADYSKSYREVSSKPSVEPIKSKELDDATLSKIDKVFNEGNEATQQAFKERFPDKYEQYKAKRIGQFETKWRDLITKSSIQDGVRLDKLAQMNEPTLNALKQQNPQVYEDFQKLKNAGWTPGAQFEVYDFTSTETKVGDNFGTAFLNAQKAAWDTTDKIIRNPVGFAKDLMFPEKEALPEVGQSFVGEVDIEYLYENRPEDAAAVVRQEAIKRNTGVRGSLGFGIGLPKQFATMEFAGKTKFGHSTFTVAEDVPGGPKAGQPFYWNAPGISVNDMQELKHAAAETAVAIGMGSQSLLLRAVTGAALAGGQALKRQAFQSAKAPEGIPLTQMGFTAATEAILSMAFDVGGEGLAAVAKRGTQAIMNIFRRTGAPEEALPRMVRPNQVGVPELTAEGRAYLVERNINEAELPAEFLQELHNVNKSEILPTTNLDEQMNIAVANRFSQTRLVADILSKTDPEAKMLYEAQDALAKTGGKYGLKLREIYDGDDTKLAAIMYKAAQHASGAPTTPSVEKLVDLMPMVREMKTEVDKVGIRLYDTALKDLSGTESAKAPLDSRLIEEAFSDIFTNYGVDPSYKPDLLALENQLIRFGVLNTPEAMEALRIRNHNLLEMQFETAKSRVADATDEKVLKARLQELAQGIKDDASAVDLNIRNEFAMGAGGKLERGFQESGERKIRRAERRGAKDTKVAEMRAELDTEVKEFREFQLKELKLSGEATADLKSRKGRRRAEALAKKEAQLADLKARKLQQLERMHQRRKELIDARIESSAAMNRDFDSLTAESAVRLHRSLSGIAESKLPWSAKKKLKDAINNTFASASDNNVVNAFQQATKYWTKHQRVFDVGSTLAELTERIDKGSSLPEISASDIIGRVKSMGVEDLDMLMDGFQRLSRRSNPTISRNAVNARRMLQSAAYLDFLDNLFDISAQKAGVMQTAESYPSATLRSQSQMGRALTNVDLDRAVGNWGMERLTRILNKEQRDNLTAIRLLLDSSQRRAPVTGLTADTDTTIATMVGNTMSNSVWLAFQNLKVAGAVGAYRFGKMFAALRAKNRLAENIIQPYSAMQKRAAEALDDPLAFEAKKVFGKDIGAEAVEDVDRRIGQVLQEAGEGVSPSQAKIAASYEYIKHAYPNLYEWMTRQSMRSAKGQVVKEPLEEVGQVVADQELNNASQ